MFFSDLAIAMTTADHEKQKNHNLNLCCSPLTSSQKIYSHIIGLLKHFLNMYMIYIYFSFLKKDITILNLFTIVIIYIFIYLLIYIIPFIYLFTWRHIQDILLSIIRVLCIFLLKKKKFIGLSTGIDLRLITYRTAAYTTGQLYWTKKLGTLINTTQHNHSFIVQINKIYSVSRHM